MDLLALLNNVKQVIYDNPNTPHQPGNDPGGLISGIENLFGKFGQSSGDRSVLSSDRDPYGDPGNREVMSASRDPLGDPGAGGRGGVRPASEDPLGDPG